MGVFRDAPHGRRGCTAVPFIRGRPNRIYCTSLRFPCDCGFSTAIPTIPGRDRTESFPSVEPEQDALVQYTSGSTGNPKGVRISHANLLTNMVQLIQGMRITPRDVFVSWLPVYHDMGLILMTLVPIFLAAPLFLLPVQLSDVHAWLDAMIRRKGTITAAPDFAYRLLLRHIKRPEEGCLSCLRVALNAAEPVRMDTIRQFESAFGLKNVMVPGYGLAEATVGVSTWPPGTPVRVDERGFLSVGPPFIGVEIAIFDNGIRQGLGQVGTIAVKSTANTVGYLNNPEETKALFLGGGFLDTGDLGYLDADGNLFVTGRRKDIILRAGQTIAPGEIEEIVDQSEDVRFSAAVGIDRGGPEGEQVYVFAEVRKPEAHTQNSLEETVLALVQAINRRMGFRPGRVYLVKPGAIPRTHNGKLKRLQLKQAHLSGELKSRGDILFPQY